MNLSELLAARRMTRNFDPRPLERAVLEEMCLLARRAPSAGFAQGAELIILDSPEQRGSFWDLTLPVERRSDFAWPGLLQAPALVLPAADSRRYLARYREADKASEAAGGLGHSTQAWSMPYWLIDCAFVVQNLLLAATERGLGALFFGLFNGEAEVRAALQVPDGVELLGVVALGWPAPDHPSGSLARGWRDREEILHWDCWGGPRR
ncbi:MAG: nitroreductase family protein [Acidimicrobiia bacterium]|nr:nitroreductase family protein [Acidimicrobiia bacterium]